jgi:hypothetical protein
MSHFQASRHSDRTSAQLKAETREATSIEVRSEIEAERQEIEERTDRGTHRAAQSDAIGT